MDFDTTLSNETTLTAETQVEDKSIVINVTTPSAEAVPVEDTPSNPEFVPYSTYALDTPSDDGGDGISGLVISILGDYRGKTQTVTEVLVDGSTVEYQQYVPGLAGLDWPWITGAFLFALVFWSFFRLLGVFLKQ